MTKKLNEHGFEMPAYAPTPSPDADDYTVDASYGGEAGPSTSGQSTSSIEIGTPKSGAIDPSTISVYANTITPVSYMTDSAAVAAFDVVFSVGIIGEDGTSKTYQVVKRIGIDKGKIAGEVLSSTPVSVVEAKLDAAAKVKSLEADWKKNNGYDDFPTARHEARAALDAARAELKNQKPIKESLSTATRFRQLAGLE